MLPEPFTYPSAKHCATGPAPFTGVGVLQLAGLYSAAGAPAVLVVAARAVPPVTARNVLAMVARATARTTSLRGREFSFIDVSYWHGVPWIARVAYL
jgi:hypothetical protein